MCLEDENIENIWPFLEFIAKLQIIFLSPKDLNMSSQISILERQDKNFVGLNQEYIVHL